MLALEDPSFASVATGVSPSLAVALNQHGGRDQHSKKSPGGSCCCAGRSFVSFDRDGAPNPRHVSRSTTTRAGAVFGVSWSPAGVMPVVRTVCPEGGTRTSKSRVAEWKHRA